MRNEAEFGIVLHAQLPMFMLMPQPKNDVKLEKNIFFYKYLK